MVTLGELARVITLEDFPTAVAGNAPHQVGPCGQVELLFGRSAHVKSRLNGRRSAARDFRLVAAVRQRTEQDAVASRLVTGGNRCEPPGFLQLGSRKLDRWSGALRDLLAHQQSGRGR